MDNKKIDIETLKRKNIHDVPDGYFDELPLRIQSRITDEQESRKPVFISRMQLTWSLTAAIVIFVIGWIVHPTNETDFGSPEQLLAEIESEYLIEYLYEENISTEEILASVDETFLFDEMTEIESESLDGDFSDEELESIYSEMDFSTEIM